MNASVSIIHKYMTLYGGLLGTIGGGLLGAGFVSLNYNPFYGMNILLVMTGTLATMLVGLVFGIICGLSSGVMMSVVTSLFFKRPRFHLVYKVLMTGVAVVITSVLFFNLAYMVGRPFVFDTDVNQTWVWALWVAVVCAMIASTQALNTYMNRPLVKTKRA